MSKLTKLVRDPRRFFLDSKPYRRYFLIKNRALGGEKPLVGLDRERYGDPAELREPLLRDIARAVPVLDLSHGHRTVLGLLREHLYHLTEYLYEAGRADGVSVEVAAKKRVVDVGSVKLFELDDFLASLESFTVRFVWSEPRARLDLGIQIWKTEEQQVVGPAANPVARRISHHTVEELGLFRRGELKSAAALHDGPLTSDVEFPVDVVYTWVNHDDPGWKELYRQKTGALPEQKDDDAQSLDRFMNRDELRYSMRSIHTHAPWVRTIYVVTNCSRPSWLAEHPKVVWVDHREIIPSESLPTFSSHAIESRLHHVPGLADHFIYFNDDFFLTRPTLASDFFYANGISMSAMEPYGTVNGERHAADPDYLNAARNGKRLLEQAFGRSPTALHKHTPYSLRKDVLFEMEERFREPIAKTTSNPFRTIDDISTVSFLYHHYAFLTGRAVYAGRDAWLIKPRTPRYEQRLAQLVQGAKSPLSLCLNDGGGSVGYSHWDRHVVEFLEALFPEPAPFEA